MNKRNPKLSGMAKLARARSFVLVTDTDATMSIDLGKGDINTVITQAEQRAALVRFRDNINAAIRKFDNKLHKAASQKRAQGKSKRIPVRQG